MKRLGPILASGVLVLSLALNIYLWSRLSNERDRLKSALAGLGEIDELRSRNQELEITPERNPESSGKGARELARLRNEISQVRKERGQAAALPAQTADVAQLKAQLAVATQNLARAEGDLAEAVKLSPEELQQLKDEAHSVQCVSKLKQIGLAARLWAHENNNAFPPDFISMSNELNSPKILFCPADGTAIRVTEWSQLNPSTISYRFLNPNGTETEPTKPPAICPVHGHALLSDGSVHRQ